MRAHFLPQEIPHLAWVAELVDALASGASGGNPVEVQVLSQAPSFLLFLFNVRYLTPLLFARGKFMIRILLTLSIIFSLGACSDEPPTTNKTKLAPELEGILVSSASPVVMTNLRGQRVYLYFFSMDCESCWSNIEKMNKERENLNMVGIVMTEDNFAAYELIREHDTNLFPVYADHDENIAYDYDIERPSTWVTVNEDGEIIRRAPTPPSEVLEHVSIQ